MTFCNSKMTFCHFTIFILFKLFILFLRLYPTYSVNYCSLPCGETANTGCHFCAYAPMCRLQPGYFEYLPTAEDRRKIVKTHNEVRQTIALGYGVYKHGMTGNYTMAADMYVVNYDIQLEHVAMCWARQCTGQNDVCRRTLKFKEVGQNFYSEERADCETTDVYVDAIYDWYNLVKVTSFECIRHVDDICQNQFLQLAWATTKYVGCGKIRFNINRCYIVCNYGPSGNIIGDSVYTVGAAASKCPELFFLPNVNKEYEGLCGYLDPKFSGVQSQKCFTKHTSFIWLSCFIYITLF